MPDHNNTGMPKAVKVTITDPETGEQLADQVIENDYVIITAGDRYVAHTNAHANGTHVLTIKRETTKENPHD